jgi:hypothetical protein
MDSQHDRLTPISQAVKQSDMPWRTVQVEVLGGQSRAGGVEFLRPTRLSKNRMTDVLFQTNVGIFHDHGMC